MRTELSLGNNVFCMMCGFVLIIRVYMLVHDLRGEM